MPGRSRRQPVKITRSAIPVSRAWRSNAGRNDAVADDDKTSCRVFSRYQGGSFQEEMMVFDGEDSPHNSYQPFNPIELQFTAKRS